MLWRLGSWLHNEEASSNISLFTYFCSVAALGGVCGPPFSPNFSRRSAFSRIHAGLKLYSYSMKTSLEYKCSMHVFYTLTLMELNGSLKVAVKVALAEKWAWHIKLFRHAHSMPYFCTPLLDPPLPLLMCCKIHITICIYMHIHVCTQLQNNYGLTR